jgi:hypothetical protein
MAGWDSHGLWRWKPRDRPYGQRNLTELIDDMRGVRVYKCTSEIQKVIIERSLKKA